MTCDTPQKSSRFSRRTLLTSSTLALASPLSPASPISAHATTTARIVIVGAGLAGLTAALYLHDHGIASTIYEASDRVGGRVYTDRSTWLNQQTSEWGGELIDSQHTTMHSLVHRCGLELEDRASYPSSQAEMTYYFGGKYYSHRTMSHEFSAIYPQLRKQLYQSMSPHGHGYNQYAQELDNIDAASWLNTLCNHLPQSPLRQLLQVSYVTENGAELWQQSALSILKQLADQPANDFSPLGNSDERYHIRGGNDQLPHAISALLPSGTIQHHHQLEAVRLNSHNSYSLYFHHKPQPIVADMVILAVPAAILTHIDLSHAGLSDKKHRAIAALRTGHNTKLNMQFSRKTWIGSGSWPGISSGDSTTDLPIQQTWETTACQRGNTGILIQYSGGNLAQQFHTRTGFAHSPSQENSATIHNVLTQLDHIYPGTCTQWNGRYALSTWHDNPYALGSYAYYPLGFMTRYAHIVRQRQKNLFFAGEYCSPRYLGFMNGAAQEGIRAAQEIITTVH